MVKRSHGIRVGTRRKLAKGTREKGKVRIAAHLQKFEVGESVLIKPDSSYHGGMPFRRFCGKQGKIVERRGNSYLVGIKDGGKFKKVICAPIHLRRM